MVRNSSFNSHHNSTTPWEGTMRIRFFGMRHGDKKGDTLTDKGILQVRASAKMHLAGIKFDLAIHSGMARAEATVRTALDEIGQDGVEVIKDLGFGYAWLVGNKDSVEFPIERKDLPECPVDPSLRTMAEWFKAWPPALAFAYRVQGALLSHAVGLATALPKQDVINVLIGSHSPTIDTAAGLYDSYFPKLSEADIVVYEAAINNLHGMLEPSIDNTYRLHCPAVKTA